MSPSIVLSRPSPCNVPQGYASVAELPAALLGCHFEHPAKVFYCRPSPHYSRAFSAIADLHCDLRPFVSCERDK